MRAGQARNQVSGPRRQEDDHRPGRREPALQLPRPEGFQQHHRRRRRHGARRVQVHRRPVRVQAGRLVRPAAGGDRGPGRHHVGQPLLHGRARQAGRLRRLHDCRHRRAGEEGQPEEDHRHGRTLRPHRDGRAGDGRRGGVPRPEREVQGGRQGGHQYHDLSRYSGRNPPHPERPGRYPSERPRDGRPALREQPDASSSAASRWSATSRSGSP